jgi:hypothetical protein
MPLDAKYESEKAANRVDLAAQYGEDNVFDTDQLGAAFEVRSFCYGVVTVTRKSDGVKGTLNFDHSPRLYYRFKAS